MNNWFYNEMVMKERQMMLKNAGQRDSWNKPVKTKKELRLFSELLHWFNKGLTTMTDLLRRWYRATEADEVIAKPGQLD